MVGGAVAEIWDTNGAEGVGDGGTLSSHDTKTRQREATTGVRNVERVIGHLDDRKR